MAKDLTAIRIPGEMIEALREIGARPGGFYSERTASWLIVQAVKEFIERNQERPQEPTRKTSGPSRKVLQRNNR